VGAYADSFRHIKNRETFYKTLDNAIAASEARPDDPGFARAAAQMRAIKKWTAKDKQPARKNIESIDIDRVIATEYEPLRREYEEVDNWAQLVGEVVLYIEHWLDDEEFSEADQFDHPWY
jgi:hypothetical protein